MSAASPVQATPQSPRHGSPSNSLASEARCRLLCYNLNILHAGASYATDVPVDKSERLAEFTSRCGNYDVLLLQGVHSAPWLPFPLERFCCHQRWLKEELQRNGFHYVEVAPQPSYYELVRYQQITDLGLMIASRFPISIRGTLVFEANSKERLEPLKGCLFAKIHLSPSASVCVFNVHLQSLHGGASQELIRNFQVTELRQLVESVVHRAKPLSGYLIAGDFNVNAIDQCSALDQFGFAFEPSGNRESTAYRSLRQLLDPHGTMTDVVLKQFGYHLPTTPLSLAFPSSAEAAALHRFAARRDYVFFCPAASGFNQTTISIPKGGVRIETFPASNKRNYQYLSDHFGIELELRGVMDCWVLRIPAFDDPLKKIADQEAARLQIPLKAKRHSSRYVRALVEGLVLSCFLFWLLGYAGLYLLTFNAPPPIAYAFASALAAVALAIAFSVTTTHDLKISENRFAEVTESVKEGESPVRLKPEISPVDLLPMAVMSPHKKSTSTTAERAPESVFELWTRSVETYEWMKCLATNNEVQKGTRSRGRMTVSWMTYRDVDSEVRRLGAAFESLGLKRGDRVAIYAGPHYRAFIVELACAAFGYVAFPVTGDSAMVRLLLDKIGARVAVTTAAYTSRILLCRSSALSTVIQLEAVQFDDTQMSDEMGLRLIPYDYLLRRAGSSTPREAQIRPSGPDDPLLILCDVNNLSDAPTSESLVFREVTNREFLRQIRIIIETNLVRQYSKEETKPVPFVGKNVFQGNNGSMQSNQETFLSCSSSSNFFDRFLLLACIRCGYQIGFGDAQDMTSLGRASSLFKPTLLVCVPGMVRTARAYVNAAVRRKYIFLRTILAITYKLRANAIRHGRDIAILRWLFFRAFSRQLGGRLRSIILLSVESLSFEDVEFTEVHACSIVRQVCFQPLVGIVAIDAIPPPRFKVRIKMPENHGFHFACPCGELMLSTSEEAKCEEGMFPSLEEALDNWTPTGLIGAWKQNSLSIMCTSDALLWRLSDVYIVATDLEREFRKRSKYIIDIFVTCLEGHPLVAIAVPNREALNGWIREAKDMESWVSFSQVARPIINEELLQITRELKLPGTHYIHEVHLHPHPFADHHDFFTLTGALRRLRMNRYFEEHIETLNSAIAHRQGIQDLTTPPISPPVPLKVEHQCFVMPLSIDIGGTCAKVVSFNSHNTSELPAYCVLDHTFQIAPSPSSTIGGQIHFISFPSNRVPEFLDFIKSKASEEQECTEVTPMIPATGGGAYKFANLVSERCGMEFTQVKEMDCIIQGLNWFLKHQSDSVFRINLKTAKRESIVLDPSEITPYLLVSVGSGVSLVKCTGDGRFVRVGGSGIGGGTFWGLVKSLTDIKSWDEVHEVTRVDGPGDNTKVDLLVGDIYGFRAESLPALLSVDIIASFFGKVGSQRVHSTPTPLHTPVEPTDFPNEELGSSPSEHLGRGNLPPDVRPPDIVRSLLGMVSTNISQIACLQGRIENVKQIFFTGGFIRDNPLVWQHISAWMNYWSNGAVQASFLKYDGYLGALGAALASQSLKNPMSASFAGASSTSCRKSPPPAASSRPSSGEQHK